LEFFAVIFAFGEFYCCAVLLACASDIACGQL